MHWTPPSPAPAAPRGGHPRLRWALRGSVALIFLVQMALTATGAAATPVQAISASELSPTPRVAATPTLNLGIQTQPESICAVNTTTCSAGVAESRVQMTVSASAPLESWPAVQIAFVIETDAFDGVYDPTTYKLPPGGLDPCVKAEPTGPVCEESNGVPFFEDYVGSITQSIAQANPHTNVSFAMLDYQGTCDIWDDPCYAHSLFHVDVSQFLPADTFAGAATEAFKDSYLDGGYVLPYEDLSSPFLHISSITALYATLAGGIFDWAPNTHHVIVWMGSAAPRDPNYPEDYCVSSSAEIAEDYEAWAGCIAPTCEPSFYFTTGASPECEGWVQSQDGNPSDSIAALAHHGADCTDSVGGSCTIDVIDLFDTPTDPESQGWPTGQNQGPGSSNVEKDSTNILLAGCDMAAATGGSWSGPEFFSCPDGSAGDLQYVAHGPVKTPNTWNPTLNAAFKGISFGPVYNPTVAVGTDKPMFTYVPIGEIAIAWNPDYTTACATPSGFESKCQVLPSYTKVNGVVSYGWNWSTNASQNEIAVGDVWTLSFNIVSTGPPYRTVPVDACETALCTVGGSGPLSGLYTWAMYTVPNETGSITQSFPLASVDVALAAGAISPTPPPPSPPTATPGLPVLVPTQVPTPVLSIIGLSTPVGTFSFQPIAGGLMGAVVTRIMVKYKPIAVAQAVKVGTPSSKFDQAQKQGPDLGRME